MKKLILIDGNAIIHRAFHALPPFSTSKGELVNAVYGFASMLLNLLNRQKPDYIAVSFDTKAKTFRHEDYKEYKATRVKAPDELYGQIPRIRELVQAFQIPIYELDGYEADDVLGTLARQARQNSDVHTYIATGDMDALQLVDAHTSVMTPHKGFNDTIIYDRTKVLEKYDLEPSQIPDMKGLQGDNSDNIKGVAGIGPKTAHDLLKKFGSIEKIYENLPDVGEKVREKLERDKENAFFSKKLATIITDVSIQLDLNACRTHDYDSGKITQFFQELEFKSLLGKLNHFDNNYIEKKKSEAKIQPSLF